MEDKEGRQPPRESGGCEDVRPEPAEPGGKDTHGDLPTLRTTRLPLPSIVTVLRNEQS